MEFTVLCVTVVPAACIFLQVVAGLSVIFFVISPRVHCEIFAWCTCQVLLGKIAPENFRKLLYLHYDCYLLCEIFPTDEQLA